MDKATITEIHEKIMENPDELIREYHSYFDRTVEEFGGETSDEETLKMFAHSQALYLLTFPFTNKYEMSVEEAGYAMCEIEYKLRLHKKYGVIEL